MMPPVRAAEYKKVLIIRGDEKDIPPRTNFYNLDTGIMSWVNYKTKEHYGKVELQFPRALMKIVKDIVEARPKMQQKYLFTTPDGGVIQEKSINKRLRDTFGVGGAELRRSYITYVLGDQFKKSIEWMNKRKTLSKQMLHSTDIQEEYIRLGLQNLIGRDD